jgi:hypothetical protein
VFCCTSEEEVKKGFDKINGAINGLGVVNEGVLIQEFLEGTEYVVDTVSRDGVSKVTAIWEYDKRHVNDQFNVYFGMKVSAASCERSEVRAQPAVLEAGSLLARQARCLRGRLAACEAGSLLARQARCLRGRLAACEAGSLVARQAPTRLTLLFSRSLRSAAAG